MDTVKSLKMKYRYPKKLISFLFTEKWYNRIKLYSIILHYKLGRPYEMSSFLKRNIDKNSIILDIGANMGHFACRFNDMVRLGDGHVYSFEPVKENFNALKQMKAILKLKQLTVFNKAISNFSGDAVINIPVQHDGLVVGTQATMNNVKGIKTRSQKIKVTTIDNVLKELNIPKLDLIKCDTEGNELRVIEGCKNSIIKFLPILLLEIDYDDNGLNWLKDLGYQSFHYDKKYENIKIASGDNNENTLLLHIDNHKRIINKIAFS